MKRERCYEVGAVARNGRRGWTKVTVRRKMGQTKRESCSIRRRRKEGTLNELALGDGSGEK